MACTANDADDVVTQPPFLKKDSMGLQWRANESTELDVTVEEQ